MQRFASSRPRPPDMVPGGGEAAAKYGPAMVIAALGALDPLAAAIAFGMVTGWATLAAVKYDEGQSWAEIRKAMIVALMVGGAGALFAIFIVRALRADPLGAALISCAIAFGGVRAIKRLLGGTMKVLLWLFDQLAPMVGKIADKRQAQAIEMARRGSEERRRMAGIVAGEDREQLQQMAEQIDDPPPEPNRD